MPKIERPRQQLRFSAGHAPKLSAPPTGGSQQLHTAPRTTDQTNRYIRKPKPGTLTAGHAAAMPGPPRGDHPTQEYAPIDRAPGSTTAAHATQPARRTHIPSNASPNSVTTRPSPHESHHDHHAHALPSPEDLNTSKFNPTGLALAPLELPRPPRPIPIHRPLPRPDPVSAATPAYPDQRPLPYP